MIMKDLECSVYINDNEESAEEPCTSIPLRAGRPALTGCLSRCLCAVDQFILNIHANQY